MNLDETRKRIMEDDAFVLSETEKLRYSYKLKKEIRYARKRKEIIDTESVAEHIYGMHVLANYFLKLEDINNEWDRLKIFETITWHDIDEIETGDILSYAKTKKDVEAAEAALPRVISRFPVILQERITELMTEYEAQSTPEARFVKAIDKLEPMFEVRGEGYKVILHENKNTLDHHWSSRRHYLDKHPYIWRFASVNTDYLDHEGYFYKE